MVTWELRWFVIFLFSYVNFGVLFIYCGSVYASPSAPVVRWDTIIYRKISHCYFLNCSVVYLAKACFVKSIIDTPLVDTGLNYSNNGINRVLSNFESLNFKACEVVIPLVSTGMNSSSNGREYLLPNFNILGAWQCGLLLRVSSKRRTNKKSWL